MKKWKNDAEKEARSNLGKKSYTKQDTIDTLEMALTGFPKKYLQQSIENIHAATSQSLEKLDPRFDVETSYNKGSAIYNLTTKIDVDIVASITRKKEYDLGFLEFFNSGKELHLDSCDVVISGSLLLETLLSNESGKIIISKPEKKAKIKALMINNESGLIEHIDDIPVVMIGGRKSVSIKGASYDGLLLIQVDFNSKKNKGRINVSSKLEQWANKDINHLPYFLKLYDFYKKLSLGWSLVISVEVNGESILKDLYVDFRIDKNIMPMLTLLEYTKSIRVIANKINQSIVFLPDVTFTKHEYKLIQQVSKLFEKDNLIDGSLFKGDIAFTFILGDDNRRLLSAHEKINDFRFFEREQRELRVFNQLINLPRKCHEFHNVNFLVKGRVDDLKDGDEVGIELSPCDGFQYIEKYVI